MSWTKRQFISQALDEIGVGDYIFDSSPEQLQSALRRLDAMMTMWNAKGIRLGYPVATDADGSSLDQDTGVTDAANEAIFLNLGVRMAPSFGKVVSSETKVAAKLAYDALILLSVIPMEMTLGNSIPAGAGNKSHGRRNILLDQPATDFDVGNDSAIEFD
jgi:hypothetical protein